MYLKSRNCVICDALRHELVRAKFASSMHSHQGLCDCQETFPIRHTLRDELNIT